MKFTEEALLTLKLDGKPVKNELSELETKLHDLKRAQADVAKGTKEWADSKKEIAELETQIKAVRETMGQAGMTVKQLKGYAEQLHKELRDLTPGTDAYIAKTKELQQVNTRLKAVRDDTQAVTEEVNKSKGSWENLKGWIMGAFGVVAIVTEFLSVVRTGIRNALDLSDTMSDVAKSTGMTTGQVEDLSKALDKIDTRTTKEGLMEIAKVGGQLGIANDELLGFVESVDRAVVALGDEFTGGADEAANKIGGLQKLFKETKDMKAGDAINDIGSALNSLGADGKATAPVIAEFTSRMGQLGDLSPQISQTMGLGAAFQELNFSAEIASGGVTNILLTAAKGTKVFADHLNITEVAMKNLINTNPNEFLLKLAESFKGVKPDEVAKRLEELGVTSQEATRVMNKLKDSTDLVRQKQELANKAMQEGTSLTDEFNLKNSNAAAEYDKSQKALTGLVTSMGQGLLPALTKATQGMVAFVNIIRAAPDFIREHKTELAALGVAMLAFNSNLVLATANSIRLAAMEKARNIWTTAGTTAQWLLNAAMTANPIGLVVAAIALLVAGFVAIYNNSSTVRNILNGLWEVIKAVASDLDEKLGPVLSAIGEFLGDVWAAAVKLGQGIATYLTPAFNSLGKGADWVGDKVTSLKGLFVDLWNFYKDLAGKVADFLDTITGGAVTKVKTLYKDFGKSVSDAFNKGYEEEDTKAKAKQLVAQKKHNDAKVNADDEAAKKAAELDKLENEKLLKQKAAEAAKHRKQQQEEAARHAKKEAEDKIKEEKDALRQIDDMRIAAIADDLEREKAKLQQKRDRELEHIKESKASQEIKAVWEKALNEQLQRDIAKVETDHRKKKQDEEDKARTEKKEKEDKERKERAEKDQKDLDERKQSEFAHSKAVLERQLEDKNLSVNKRRELELALLKLEYEENLRVLNARFQAAIALAEVEGRDTTNLKASWDAQKTTLEEAYQANTVRINKEAQEAKKAKAQEYYQALSDMMDGNFTTLGNLLMKELGAFKSNLSEKAQAALETASKILGYVDAGLQAASKLNEKELEKQLERNKSEKEDALKKWEEKYKAGLITKATYEIGMDRINKDFDAKEKELKFKAWRRAKNIEIARAIVNGLQAALMSFAAMGWPLGLIGAAAAGVTTRIMIKNIKAEEPPVFKRGGFVNAGVPQGPGHERGGIKLVDNQTGEVRGEMEGGEPIMILSRRTYANNKKVIDKLLRSSLHQNGKPIYRDGGIYADSPGDYRLFPEGGVIGGREGMDNSNGMGKEQEMETTTSGGDPTYWDTQAGEGYLGETGDYSGAYSASGQYEADVAASKELMQKVVDNTARMVQLMEQNNSISEDQTGVLHGINGNTQRAADKPPVTINQITQETAKVENAQEQSTFRDK